MKCKRESDARTIDHYSLEVMRQQAVKAVHSGQSAPEVARAYGVNVRTMFRWLADFSKGGQSALLAKPIPGRPPKLGPDRLHWLATALRDNTPLQFNLQFGLWTLPLLSDLIHRELGQKLSRVSVSRVVWRLGFTMQHPLRQALQQNPVMVRLWKRRAYPALQAQARADNAAIFFFGESSVRPGCDSSAWAPEQQTIGGAADDRSGALNILLASGLRGDFSFMFHKGQITSSVFCEFLKRLMVGRHAPAYVVVDGLPIYKAKQVQTYVNSLGGQLQLVYLPHGSVHQDGDARIQARVQDTGQPNILANTNVAICPRPPAAQLVSRQAGAA